LAQGSSSLLHAHVLARILLNMMFLLLTVASGLLQVVDEVAEVPDRGLLDSEQVVRQDLEEAPEMSFAEVDASALAQMDASSLGAAMSSQLRAEVDELLGLAKAQLATEVEDKELLAQLEAAMEERIDLEVEELEDIAMQQLHQELAEAQGTSFVQMDESAEEELPPMENALQGAMQQVQALTSNPQQLEMLTTQLKREISGLEKVLEEQKELKKNPAKLAETLGEQKERLVQAIAEMEKQGTKKNIRKAMDEEIAKVQQVMEDLKSMKRNPKKIQQQVAQDVAILQKEVAALEEVLAAPEKLSEMVDQNIQRVQDALTRLYDMTSSPEKLTASLQADLQSLQGMLEPGASFLEQEEVEEEVPALEGERLLPKLAEMFLPQEQLVEA